MDTENRKEKPEEELTDLLNNTQAIYTKSLQLMQEYLAKQQDAGPAEMDFGGAVSMNKAFAHYLEKALENPARLLEIQMGYWTTMQKIWQNMSMSWLGMPSTEPVISAAKHDKRFVDQEWEQLPFFSFLKQAYLASADYLQKMAGGVEGLDRKSAQQVNFFTRQFVNAISPSNFILTNPQVLQKTLSSKGENLLQGLENMLKDLEENPGQGLHISMTDKHAFTIGKNIATTKGQVVFQNRMLQLIQYEPTTKHVAQRPILIMPPWINKYYILDLQPENSLVKYLTDQGFTVFIISWVNPTKDYANTSFADYLQTGALEAIEAVKNATNESSINIVGYCIGGTLLAMTLAYLGAKKDTSIASATYLATMIDFSDPGELGVFIDEEQVSDLEKRMKKKGYLEGSAMSNTFNLLRSNELIWSYFVHNYLLGEEPFPFDLLYWNCDNTNLPAAMHSYYLRQLYMHNNLVRPNALTIAGTPIDLGNIKVPVFFLSCIEDHIAPWKSTYAATQLHRAKVEFVLSGSGHIAGIVNPPIKNKYCYWTNKKLTKTPQEWLDSASSAPGSWWPHWVSWLQTYSGEKVAARKPGAGKLKVIEPAPGSYVQAEAEATTS